MRTHSRRSRTLVGVGLASSALALGTTFAAGSAASAAGTDGSDIVYTVHPLTKQFSTGTKPGALPTPSQCVAGIGLACYTPALIRKAYDVPDGWTGKGQRIVIVDAYGSPTVRGDLDVFSQTFGLPKADLNVYYPAGRPQTSTAHRGQPLSWAGETSLDVQWAHAIAPDATINLVVAPNNYGNALNVAVKYAVDHDLGDVLSMSYGADEAAIKGKGNNLQVQQSHANFAAAAAKGISLFASSGDDGASNGGPALAAGYPASDPLVTAVGGTNLFASDSGAYEGETVWGDEASCAVHQPFGCTLGPIGATGGAPSTIFPAPAYQAGVNGNAMRTTSDVSYNASVYTSVFVYEGFNANPDDNGFYFYGGTSSGSPQWAAIGALADQQAGHRLGTLNPALYAIGTGATHALAFHDVTSGNNAWQGPGLDAKAGYDDPTGLGSPDVSNLVGQLVH
ncbi:S53 family peptidase [Terrabacter sp. Ter38]|uniref:S53 family peptidase n=1 Tax=Terrabacter sp. Ter38 TaxID=2926030 RepID=UPI0021173795|nr:S53 family peptidase [Terrabacter sp. Ter38]